MKKILIIMISVMVAAMSSSCALLLLVAAAPADEGAVQIVRSNTSGLVLEFPSSWTKDDLHDEASVQMSYPSGALYFCVLEGEASDYVDHFTLDDYGLFVLNNFLETTEVDGTPQYSETTIGTGNRVKQTELHTVIDGMKISYFITIAKAAGVYYQIHAWTLNSKYMDAKPVFDRILDSADFGEIASFDEPIPVEDTEADVFSGSFADDFQLIATPSSNLVLAFPPDWQEGYDIPGAAIEMDHLSYDYYVVVYEDHKDDFAGGFTFDDFSYLILSIFVYDAEPDDIDSFGEFILDGNIKARHIELIEYGFETNYMSYIVCAETDEYFYYFLGRSTSAVYEESRPVFESIILSAAFTDGGEYPGEDEPSDFGSSAFGSKKA